MAKTLKEVLARREAIKVRFHEIADTLLKEQREMNDAEIKETAELEREMKIIDLQLLASGDNSIKAEVKMSREAMMDEFLRENRKAGGEFPMMREAISTSTPNANSTFPLTVEDILLPLEEGLIMKSVGLKTRTGLVGQFLIPGIGSVEARVAGEKEKLADSDISFSQLKPKQERVGITAVITNQLINQSAGVAYEYIKIQLAAGLERALNRRMFITEGAIADALVGPFYALGKETGVAISAVKTLAQKKAVKKINFAGAVPTLKELTLMRTAPAVRGVTSLNGGYVMDAALAGELECTPKDAGSGVMILENGKIGGYPVFITNFIDGESACNVGFGFFGYEGFGQFGEMRVVVDPYTGATEDTVRITLNGDWAMTAVRPEAFTLGVCAAE
jgi:HK97 family phage major capsid protein